MRAAAASKPRKRASELACELMQNPTFRQGHDDAWRGRAEAVRLWDQSERLAYRQGHDFGLWLQAQGIDRQAFTKGAMLNTEVVSSLIDCLAILPGVYV